MHHSARYRSFLGAAATALVALSLAAPAARADDRHDHRDRHFRDHHYYVPAPAPVYVPPPVYAPPVVEAPGINLVFPLHFR